MALLVLSIFSVSASRVPHQVSAFLKAQLEEMKASRASDAKVLEEIKQDPAGEIKVSGDQKNIFGIERTQIDAELDRFVQKEA